MARFLTFEGLDGSGKSTHLRNAAEWLRARGERVETTREPGGTGLGDGIRGLFLDRRWGDIDGRVEAMLVFASRRQHLVERIEPTLEAGAHVLCDRFTDSSLAYQGAGRGLGSDWIRELDRLATGGRRPDHTFLFDLPPEVARSRGQKHDRSYGPPDRLDGESLAFYGRARQAYLEMAAAEPDRFVLVDSSGPADATWAQVESALGEIFGTARPHAEAAGNRG